MKTFYEYIKEQQNLHENKYGWGALGLGAGLALGLGGPAALKTTSPTTQVSTQNPQKISPAKILADKLERKYGPEIHSLNYIIKSIQPEGNTILFKGSATNLNDDTQKEFENKVKARIKRLISAEGKIENFQIMITEKIEKYIEKTDTTARILILNAADQYARKTKGELEVEDNPLGTFYFIKYKDGNKINYLSHGQMGAMSKGDIKSKFGRNINILEKSDPHNIEFNGQFNVLE
jgi:hypothetical protein